MSRYVYVWVLSAALVACGDDGPGGPPVPTSLEIISGSQQTAQVGQRLAEPIQVQARAGNQPAAGVTIAFAVTGGGGRLSRTTAITDDLGQTSVVWILGGQIGTQSLTVSTAGLAAQTVTANAEAGPPSRLFPVAGNTQFAVVTLPVAVKPRVRLQDGFGNPLEGHTITFSLSVGGGGITDSVQVTNGAGEVELGSWTLGPTPGINRVRVAFDDEIETELLAIGTPQEIIVLAGDDQEVNAGTQVPVRPTVLALGPAGGPLAGADILFTVSHGGGNITAPSQQTDGQGIARVGSWTLGLAPGENRIIATSPGLPPLTFTATGLQAVAASAVAASPTNLDGLAGNFVSNNPTIRVTDAGGSPVAGLPVTFEVTSGGGVIASPGIGEAIGLLAAAGTVTDSSGHAMLAAWRLGPSPGSQGITAAVSGFAPVIFTADAQPVPPSEYQVVVRYQGTPPSQSQQAAFTSAAARWEALILGDLPDVQFVNQEATPCSPELNETVDDLLIFAEVATIDGPGGILAQAGACWYREEGLFPITGIMRFDSSDLANLEAIGLLQEVILHEMGHVIGFHPFFWNGMNLMVGLGGADPYFTGPSARSAWRFATVALNFTGNIVPLEHSGGPGTQDAHWRESVARNELMTGFIDPGANPLSAITVSLFRDMGHLVNDSQADQFTLAQLLQSLTAPPLQLRERDLDSPLYLRDRQGRRVGTRPRSSILQ